MQHLKTFSMEKFKLEGLIAAPVTPFYENGELNVSIIGKYIDILRSQGITKVYLNGFTGEGASLTVNERKLVAEKWIKEGKDKLETIIVQVGGTNLKDSQQLALHAKSIGASAIASLPPLLYHSCVNVSSLVEYCQQVAAVVPDLPFIYYHIPPATNVYVKIEKFLQAADDKIPNLVGVKFSHVDIFDVSQSLLVASHKFNIATGFDEGLLSTLAVGVTSAIGSTYNYNGKLNLGIIDAFKKGDMKEAQKLQYKAQDFIKILLKHGGHVGVTKAILCLTGLDTGPPRLPMIALNKEELALLKHDLNEAGFFESQ